MPSRRDPQLQSTRHEHTLETKLDAVLAAIEHTRTSLEHKIDMIAADLSLLPADHHKLADKVCNKDQTLAVLQSARQTLEDSVQTLTHRFRLLE